MCWVWCSVAEGIAWWFTFGSGAVLGFVVAAITGARMRRVSRFFDRLLDDDECHRMECQRSIPLPVERDFWPN